MSPSCTCKVIYIAHDGFKVRGGGFKVRGGGSKVKGGGCKVRGGGSKVRGGGSKVRGPHAKGVQNVSNRRENRPDLCQIGPICAQLT
eukprot:3004911-Pyramimonas_sp.AAC.1